MKTRWILSLLFCGLLFSVLYAEDEAVVQKVPTDQTAQIPKASSICLRLPSLERMDAIAKRFVGVAEMMEGAEAKNLIEAGVTNAFFMQMGLDPTGFDRKAPIYLAFMEGQEDPYMLMTPAKENGIKGEKELMGGQAKLIVKDGVVHVSTAELLAAEKRGTAVKLLKGDLALKVLVSERVERHKERIEGAMGEMKGEAKREMENAPIDVPFELDAMFDAMKEALYGIQDVQYALTVDEKYLLTEGLITTKAESSLRKMFARAGAPMENSMADYLPEEAFLTVDSAVTPDWPILELTQFLKKAAGAEAAEAFGQMISVTKPMWSSLTGRSAVSMTMQGIMGFNMHGMYELKAGTDASKLFDSFDVEKMNAAMAKMELPIKYVMEKNIAKHGETALHKMSLTSDDPDMQMLLMMSTYYLAAEGNHMFMVMSMNPELEITDLIDRVRKGQPKAGAHSKAMDRLSRKRNMGMTINFGALKPLLVMLAMGDGTGQMNAYLNAMPDQLLMSTALSVHDGDIHWRGDLPLQQILKMIDDIKALQGGEDGADPGDSEFD